ncbi:MAG: DNA-processing protein DprA [Oscillospiraceae bacterium]|nr:DNA-processing protein DprA [Oscillospiraceae bacterium]
MAALKYWVWLSSAPLSASVKAELIRRYGDAEAVYDTPCRELKKLGLLSGSEAAALERHGLTEASRILGECQRQGLQLVTLADAAYPQRLKNIYAPPVVLYVKGRLPAVDELAAIAVVGTRGATPYGLKMGRDLAYGIIRCGGAVISGLTSGVDAAAADGALLAGGPCIAVLGTSHERDRSRLTADVAAAGAVLSEYPPGSPDFRSHFRERNRIAAGLSVGVVVVEAPEKSGALLFAAEANEQGREIFAVPGNADAPNSAGTIALMQEGAMPVRSAWDVMEEFKPLYPGLHDDRGKKAPEPVPLMAERPAEPVPTDKKPVDKQKSSGYIDLHEQLSQLNAEQLKIISAIDKGSSHIDDIIEETGLGTAKVLAQLTVLEIKGFVRREAGRRVSLNTVKK